MFHLLFVWLELLQFLLQRTPFPSAWNLLNRSWTILLKIRSVLNIICCLNKKLPEAPVDSLWQRLVRVSWCTLVSYYFPHKVILLSTHGFMLEVARAPCQVQFWKHASLLHRMSRSVGLHSNSQGLLTRIKSWGRFHYSSLWSWLMGFLLLMMNYPPCSESQPPGHTACSGVCTMDKWLSVREGKFHFHNYEPLILNFQKTLNVVCNIVHCKKQHII